MTHKSIAILEFCIFTFVFSWTGLKLQQALQLIQFIRECDEVRFWISDKETFVTSEEFGHDLEHVEVLQKKYDEFAKVRYAR